MEDKDKDFIVQAIFGEYITPEALEPIISENTIAQLPPVLKKWHESFTGSPRGPRGGKKTKRRSKGKAKKTRKAKKSRREKNKRKVQNL